MKFCPLLFAKLSRLMVRCPAGSGFPVFGSTGVYINGRQGDTPPQAAGSGPVPFRASKIVGLITVVLFTACWRSLNNSYQPYINSLSFRIGPPALPPP